MNTKRILTPVTILITLLMINGTSRAQALETSAKTIGFNDFTINVNEKKIDIKWSTDTAVATNYFEVQKSTDGVNYRTILMVLGSDPKQINCNCYGCFDKFVRKTSKHSYYRLVHVATDGTVQVSEPKKLKEEKQQLAQK